MSEQERGMHTHECTHVELQVDSPWLADPVNERLSFTPKQRAETIKIPRWSYVLSRLYFLFLTIERGGERRQDVGATVSCFRARPREYRNLIYVYTGSESPRAPKKRKNLFSGSRATAIDVP